MKLRDTVYYLTDREIVKTKITGKKETLEKPYGADTEEKVLEFRVIGHGSYAKGDEHWVKESELFSSLDEAQKVIEARITQEVVEQLSRIQSIDVTGERKNVQ